MAMSANADLTITVINNSNRTIYVNGGSGTWDEVDWGPVWQMTQIGPWSTVGGPLSWNNFTKAGSAHGSAGYALSATATPTENIVNFTFMYQGSSGCASGCVAENQFQSNTWTCLKVDNGTGTVNISVNSLVNPPQFVVTYNG